MIQPIVIINHSNSSVSPIAIAMHLAENVSSRSSTVIYIAHAININMQMHICMSMLDYNYIYTLVHTIAYIYSYACARVYMYVHAHACAYERMRMRKSYNELFNICNINNKYIYIDRFLTSIATGYCNRSIMFLI